ncbi:hypothetical protein EOL70_06335 [Leucothrix sargassi]|nr:hypothetical protein EOL70_06335 [Leucothrix sargassi]
MSNKKQQREIRAQKQAAAQAAADRKAKLMRLLLIGIAGLAVLLVLFTAFRSVTMAPPSVTEIVEADHIKGNPDAAITIVEYSDLQCPACRAQHESIQKVWPAVKGSVRFVYRHFPLTNIHPHALTAAYYSEAAAKQGKFWEMHDLMFAGQSGWTSAKDVKPVFDGYVAQLGLDKAQFDADLASDEVKAKVATDAQSAKKAQAASTPSLFLNGKLMTNVREPEQFKEAIRAAVKAAK